MKLHLLHWTTFRLSEIHDSLTACWKIRLGILFEIISHLPWLFLSISLNQSPSGLMPFFLTPYQGDREIHYIYSSPCRSWVEGSWKAFKPTCISQSDFFLKSWFNPDILYSICYTTSEQGVNRLLDSKLVPQSKCT